MANWAEAGRRLDALREEAKNAPRKETVYESALNDILWMAGENNQHLDMFDFIHRAASLGLSAQDIPEKHDPERGRGRPGETFPPFAPEDGEDIPWPPTS